MSKADQGRTQPPAAQAAGGEEPWTLEAPEELVGQVVDQRYLIEALLATGGMGSVYRAEHTFIGRKIALKVLHPFFQASPEVVERFRREAQIAVQLRAPNVVEVLDFGRTLDGRFYLAMELLEGESLQDVLGREQRLPPARAVVLLRQLVEGLKAVHGAGVVHRDLKPENLWLVPSPEGERLKIIDFGIAKLADLPAGSTRTRVGLVVGTPEYIAPEQAAGRSVDVRADLYAVGLIAWVAVCGRHPFPTADLQGLMHAQAYSPVPRVTEACPELSAYPRLVEAITRATLKDPAERTASAEQLLALLEGAEVAVLGEVVPTPLPGPAAARPTFLPHPSSGLDDRPARGALGRATGRPRTGPRKHRKVGLTLAAVLATASVVAALALRTPIGRAHRALAEGRPHQALELLAEEAPSADVLLLRARALHALSRHDDEMARFVEFTRLFPSRMARKDPLAQVIEHLGGPASGRAQEVLAQLGTPAADALAKAAVDKNPRRRWAALEVLRGLGEERRADLVASYIADLDLRECAVVKGAARRLGELGDMRAVAPLRMVAIRKGADLLGAPSEACEAGAARAALKKLGEWKEPVK